MVDLFIPFNAEDEARNIVSCSKCDTKNSEKKQFELSGILTTITPIAVPAIMVFLGLQK